MELPASQSRRGLGLALVAQAILALWSALLAVVIEPGALTVLVVGLTGLLAMGSLGMLWSGRSEFGGDRGRPLLASWIALGAAALLLAAFAASVATTVPQTLRTSDLRAPMALLPLLIVSEAAASGLAIWPWAGGRSRWILAAFGAGSAAAAVILTVRGVALVEDLRMRFGEEVSTAATGHEVVKVFLQGLMPAWMGWVFAGRLLLCLALWGVLGDLVRREADRPPQPSSFLTL